MLAPLTVNSRDDALAFLLGRIDYERTSPPPFGSGDIRLDRMRDLLARLGRPEVGLPVVHVAGTKGKGSTSAMIASMLTSAGLRTGLYTSPHLSRIEERWTIDGQECSAEELIELVRSVAPAAAAADSAAPPGEAGPTYFDLTTAMALLHFRRCRVDAAVLEVGLGGRLDSTNVCQPLATVITSISFDHTRQLGGTLEAIAGEKAGIIKAGVPAISGVTAAGPAAVIADVARERGAPLYVLGRDFDATYRPPRDLHLGLAWGQIDYRSGIGGKADRVDHVELGLLGSHQAANAALALAACEFLQRLGGPFPETALRRGLRHVRWPARIEPVCHAPTVVIDSAHNVASVEALLQTLEESFSPRRRTLVFATSWDKEVRAMLERLLPRFDRVVLTRYESNPRGLELDELARLAREIAPDKCATASTPALAWQGLRSALAPDDLVCVTGSVFIAGEMRALVGARPPKNPG